MHYEKSDHPANDVETSPAGKLADEDLAHYECCIHAAMEHFGVKEHA